MPVSISEQTIVFISCICAGLAMGLVYDFIRGIRNGFEMGKAVVFLLDSLFWVIGVILFFSALYITCGGSIEWFGFVGVFLGLCFYLCSFSHIIAPVMINAVKGLKKIIIMTMQIILRPFFFLLSIFLRFFGKFFSPIHKVMQNVRNKQRNFVKKTIEKLRRFSVLLYKE